MSFKNYYESVQQTFNFRIKSIGRIGDDEMDVIERVIDKYRPSKISQPKKMMFQTEPLGFTGIENAEVWYIDVTLTVPGHAPTICYDLNTAFGFAGNSPMIQVAGDHDDPTDAQEETLKAEHDALLLDPDYTEAEDIDSADHFGDAYNTKFLGILKKVEEDREFKKKPDAPHPITKWSQQPKDLTKVEPVIDTTHFNASLVKDQDKRPKFHAREKPKSPKESD